MNRHVCQSPAACAISLPKLLNPSAKLHQISNPDNANRKSSLKPNTISTSFNEITSLILSGLWKPYGPDPMRFNTGAPSELAVFELVCANWISLLTDHCKVCFGNFHMHGCQWPLLAGSVNALIASAPLHANTDLQYKVTIGKHS